MALAAAAGGTDFARANARANELHAAMTGSLTSWAARIGQLNARGVSSEALARAMARLIVSEVESRRRRRDGKAGDRNCTSQLAC